MDHFGKYVQGARPGGAHLTLPYRCFEGDRTSFTNLCINGKLRRVLTRSLRLWKSRLLC